MDNLKALVLNLQLFGEEEDPNDGEGVVDLPEEETPGELSEEGGVADHQEPEGQTPEENAQFKKMRLRAEEEARTKLEAERAELTKLKREMEEKQQEKELRDEYLSPDKVWAKADEEGVSESVAKKLLEAELKSKIDSEKQKVRERFDFVQNEKRELQKDPFYNDLAPEMESILKERPDLNPSTVYYHLKGQKADELYNKHSKNSEKRTIANMQDSLKRRGSPASSSGDVNGDISNLSDFGKEMASAFGNDPREIAKYVRQNKR